MRTSRRNAPSYSRQARLGEETIILIQFLQGIAQYDDAHVLRIREWVHPALLGAA